VVEAAVVVAEEAGAEEAGAAEVEVGVAVDTLEAAEAADILVEAAE
jgi:hypothetical protein